ncbi:hypothetical protein QJS10_CPA10g01383 [Acorus calamus]|uniref:CCHC-type domain-containing protein n=1 Tax=Acorus calamus TaxID=4465 RepID=A0AAV9E0Y6_ACOCL|nr:hypothetical protein QJS10_CPA10g01383 [Acorus calamus]
MRNARWEDYVDEYFTVARYKATYALAIYPLPDKSMWESQDLQCIVKPPKLTRPPGRPRKKWIRPHDEESRSTKVRRIHKCQRCGGIGHHQKTCKNPPVQDSSSRGASTEASSSKKRPPGRPKKQDGRGKERAVGGRGGREVRGLNPHCGMLAEGRGIARGFVDGEPIMHGPTRGYGRGMFSYGTSVVNHGHIRGKKRKMTPLPYKKQN